MLSAGLYKLCVILVLIGAIVMGVHAIANWNAIEWVTGIFGESSKATISKILYVLMGIAGVLLVFEPRILIQ